MEEFERMGDCPTRCRLPKEAVRSRKNPMTFLSYPPLPLTPEEMQKQRTPCHAQREEEKEEEGNESSAYTDS